ncbi:MAG: flagellar basal body-associated FliL family protein [Desulfobaccales bacterium]
MCRRLLLRVFPCLCLLLAFPGSAGVHQSWGQVKEIAPLNAGPIVEAKIGEKRGFENSLPVVEGKIGEKARAENSLPLDPFYLIEEDGPRVRVLRVALALEFAQPEMKGILDPQAPRLREIVYDFLANKEHDPGLEGKGKQEILAGLVNRYLGQEAVTAVKVDQSYLLLP